MKTKNLSEKEKNNIVDVLNKKGVSKPCPMCGNQHFVVADGYFVNTIQNSLRGITLGGPNIPTISIICSNCGFVSQHALGVLGLLNDESSGKK